MKTEEIASLVARLERAGVSELSYSDGTQTLILRFAEVAGQAAHPVEEPVKTNVLIEPPLPRHKDILSGATGAFSRAHPLAAGAFSDAVRQGDHVGYLTIDSVLSAIIAPADGRTGNQFVDDGKTIGYGDAVLELHDT
ncbi:hypothetical protein [Cupriavidus sp. PET2-C1]